MTLDPINKSALMLLAEAVDPEHRDIRIIVKALYDEHGRLESVAEGVSDLCGRTVHVGTVHQWMASWGWTLGRVLITTPADPEPAEEKVPA